VFSVRSRNQDREVEGRKEGMGQPSLSRRVHLRRGCATHTAITFIDSRKATSTNLIPNDVIPYPLLLPSSSTTSTSTSRCCTHTLSVLY
jgi:hypothetical protein